MYIQAWDLDCLSKGVNDLGHITEFLPTLAYTDVRIEITSSHIQGCCEKKNKHTKKKKLNAFYSSQPTKMSKNQMPLKPRELTIGGGI